MAITPEKWGLLEALGDLIGMGLLQDKIAVFDLKKNKIVVE